MAFIDFKVETDYSLIMVINNSYSNLEHFNNLSIAKAISITKSYYCYFMVLNFMFSFGMYLDF